MRALKGKTLVGGEGPRRAKLILVGESLGEQEERSGRPFVGTDGRILDGILASAGIRREECYVTNVVKVRPPGNKVSRISEYGLTIEDFVPLLKEELSAIESPVCVPLGDLALNALTGLDGIMKWRGSIVPSTLCPHFLCVPTYNPGFVREMWQSRGVVVADLKKALRVAKEGYKEEQFHTIIRPSLEQVSYFLANAARVGKFAFDLEVQKRSQQILCVGIGYEVEGIRYSMSIPLKDKYIPERGYTNYWSSDEERYLWSLLKSLFDSDALKVGQNINYDITYLAPFIGEPAPPWYDLMVAHHLIDPELPHDLAFLTSIYTDVPYYKDDPKEKGEGWSQLTPNERLWEYNGKDVEIPLMIEPILTKELKDLGLYSFFVGYQMPLLRAMWRVQQRGMVIDQEKKEEMLREAEERRERLQKEIQQHIGHELNVNSPKQMIKFLYEELKLPIQYHRKTKRPTADKETLERLFARFPNPVFKLALDIRDLQKLIGTYLSAEPDEDGRIRGRYNICGTETGRSSSSKTYFSTGIDMQNIPRSENGEGVRSIFKAPPGKVLLCYDLWQAEAYCVAVFAGCSAFLERLKRGKKIHSLVASWIFSKSEEEISDEEYTIGKRTVHAANYGLGPNLFATLIKKPIKEAKAILATYHRYAPEVQAWHREIQAELERTRKLVTPFGRIRFFRNRFGEEMFREAYAHLPQSTIADYLHQALVKFEYSYPKGASIVQEGFDSFIVECDEDKVEEVDKLVQRCFDKTLYWHGIEFKIPSEMKVMRVWK